MSTNPRSRASTLAFGESDKFLVGNRNENRESQDSTTDKGAPVLEGSVKVNNIVTGIHKVLCCANHSTKNVLAVGTAEGIIEVKGTKTGRILRQFQDESGLPITSLSFTDDKTTSLLLGSCASGSTSLWNCKSGSAEWSIKEDRQTLVSTINPDGTSFLAGGTDCKITNYDMETRQLIGTFEASVDPDVMDGHRMRIFDIEFNPAERNQFISGGWDNTIQFWDTRVPHSVRNLYGPHICGDGIEFLELGKKFVTASWTKEDALQMWDYGQGTLLETLTPDEYKSFLYSCQYVEKGNFLVTGGCKENMFRGIDMNSKTSIALLKDLPHGVCFVKVLPQRLESDMFHQVAVGTGNDVYMLELLV